MDDFMWRILICMLIGYLFGCISPAAIVGKIKKHDLRKEGTGNLGTTNAVMVLGKRMGAIVLFVDVFKTVAAYHITQLLFPEIGYAGLLSGAFVMVGHIFPFYLKGRGGKGLASFLGLVLAHDPLMLLVILVLTILLAILVNYGFMMPFAGAALFCLFTTLKTPDFPTLLITLFAGGLIVYKHFGNFLKALRHEDIRVRDYIKKHIFKSI